MRSRLCALVGDSGIQSSAFLWNFSAGLTPRSIRCFGAVSGSSWGIIKIRLLRLSSRSKRSSHISQASARSANKFRRLRLARFCFRNKSSTSSLGVAASLYFCFQSSRARVVSARYQSGECDFGGQVHLRGSDSSVTDLMLLGLCSPTLLSMVFLPSLDFLISALAAASFLLLMDSSFLLLAIVVSLLPFLMSSSLPILLAILMPPLPFLRSPSLLLSTRASFLASICLESPCLDVSSCFPLSASGDLSGGLSVVEDFVAGCGALRSSWFIKRHRDM
eukprot:Gregarina_sp_Poly_1__11394@NODE_969_length_5525_cov_113_202272_g685_i0_p4_GENE_NODE_969_length_5525_cov_113_202272_g685_i0NODE_969_length_5525_cov_113_202272_g685_i0_p4_ORF_typecomplete_len277_score29_91Ribosomal_S14/PF00253_21/3_2e03Ribosomal_S14/PF00253_21/0_15Gaa1/PF04114_14/0_88_NODE_969_length_5525_cov_113_202272_g685_i017732603